MLIENVDEKSEQSNYEKKSLLELADFYRGITFKKDDEVEDKGTKVLRANNVNINGSLNMDDIKIISNKVSFKDSQKLFKNDILMCTASGSKEHIGKTSFIKEDLDITFGGFMGVLRTKEIMNPRLLYFILKDEKFNEHLRQNIYGANINNINNRILESFRIPAPPIETQNQIVDELDAYQKIIDGCRQVVENYKPSIDIDPSWDAIELDEIAEVISGQSPPSSSYNIDKNGLPFYQGKTDYGDIYLKDTNNYTSEITKISKKNDIIMSVRAPVGPVNLNPFEEICIGRGLCAIRPKNKEDLEFIFNYLQADGVVRGHMGATYESINRDEILKIKIPNPDKKNKDKIINQILEERKIIEGNKKIIVKFLEKISNTINKIWSN